MGSGWVRPGSEGGLGAVSVLLDGQRLSWLLERLILGGTMGIGRESGSKTETGRYGEATEGRGEVWRSRESRGESRLDGAKNWERHNGEDWSFLLVGTLSTRLSV